jgi:hypothetical protein
MGLYKYLPDYPTQPLEVTQGGIAYRTTSRLLGKRRYDDTRTKALNLPNEAGGAVFHSESDNTELFVLWAKALDDTEQAAYDYHFPASWNVEAMDVYQWDESKSSLSGNTIRLTESPVFVRITKDSGNEAVHQGVAFEVSPTISSGQFTVKFDLPTSGMVELNVYSLTGSLCSNLLPRQLLPSGAATFNFDVSLAPGVYLLILQKPSGRERRKIVIR